MSTNIAELPALDVAHALSNPRSFAALANGSKLEGDSFDGIVGIAREGLALEVSGTIAQAVSAYVWTASKTGTMKEWSDAVGVELSASRMSVLASAGKALVTIDCPQGITPVQIISAASRDSKGVREAGSKTKLAATVRKALAAREVSRRKATPPTGETPQSTGTPKVTEGTVETDGPTVELQGHVRALVAACEYLSDRAERLSTADSLTVKSAVTVLVDALIAQANNVTAAA